MLTPNNAQGVPTSLRVDANNGEKLEVNVDGVGLTARVACYPDAGYSSSAPENFFVMHLQNEAGERVQLTEEIRKAFYRAFLKKHPA